MKNLILTLVILFITFFSNSQINVITVEKNEKVPLNVWYMINEKVRENNIYITFEDENLAIYSLGKLLEQFNVGINDSGGIDDSGDEYWVINQTNSLISDVYYSKEKDFPLFTITVVTIWTEQ